MSRKTPEEFSVSRETPEFSPATISVIDIKTMPPGNKLHALVDVAVLVDDVEIVIHGVQIRSDATQTAVVLPTYRGVDGTWKPAISLPEEIREALADVVLNAGLDAGVLREK